ncbi:DUF4185 domain-containing protein [Candidatus Saccharibacteria bacterium]|nr:DUF4185 domain-containing protein [Candidatus Saccharibacteria bacterium]
MEIHTINTKREMPKWIKKVAGANMIAATFFLPACTSASDTAHETEQNIAQEVQLPVADRITRDTGLDMQPCYEYKVCGTDLGIPFLLPNNSVGYLFGDTFSAMGPYVKNVRPGRDGWRSPVILRSNVLPEINQPIIFDSAAGISGTGVAPEVMYNGHRNSREISIYPNDAISLPDGRVAMSYMSVGGNATDTAKWASSYAGIAISNDGGNTFDRMLGSDHLPGPGDPVWSNNRSNTDPNQMWSMQRDGDYIYIITARAGRQTGPMMMLRVLWQHITDKRYYECWNGENFGGECQPLLPESKYGEPSLRKLGDTWVMSYVDYTHAQLMTRTASTPTGPWSEPKIQMNWRDLNALYGGFIHPYSTPNNLILMVSTWQSEDDGTEHGNLLRYDVSHLVGSV